MPHKVLVTGGTGCLGSNLVRHLLASGRSDVVVFKRPADALGPLEDVAGDVEFREGDVRDLDSARRAVRDVDAVFHFAAIAQPLNRLADQMWEVNVGGTYNVALAAKQAGVTRLVHVSSVAAIGFPPDGTVASETFSYADSVCRTAYSITKHWSERIALGLSDDRFQVVAVNPSAVIAPGGDRRFGWAAVVETARRGWLRFYSSGGSAFCARRDLVHGLVRAMDVGRPGERYIISSTNLPYRDFLSAITTATGIAPPRLCCPRPVLTVIGRWNDCRSALQTDPAKLPVLVSENTDLMSRSIYYDQSKAVRELGLTQSPLTEAVDEVVNWCASGAMPPIGRDAAGGVESCQPLLRLGF